MLKWKIGASQQLFECDEAIILKGNVLGSGKRVLTIGEVMCESGACLGIRGVYVMC